MRVMKQKKVNMQEPKHLSCICSSYDDGIERPPSLAYPCVIGGIFCTVIILVTWITFLDPYLAVIICDFVFCLVFIAANFRFYRRRKAALRRIARRAAEGNTSELVYVDAEIHSPQNPKPIMEGNTGNNGGLRESSAELNLPQNTKPVIEGNTGNKGGLRESRRYSVIADIQHSKDPSKHTYMNYRKEAESDPEKDKLYINPRHSLLSKKSVEVTVSDATTVSDVMPHDDTSTRDEGTTEDGTVHKPDRQSDVKMHDDTTVTK